MLGFIRSAQPGNARPALRPTYRVAPEVLNVSVVCFMMLVHNQTMFERLSKLAPTGGAFILVGLMAFGVTLAFVTLLSFFPVPLFQKVVLGLLLILSSITAHFTDHLGAVFDDELVNNIFHTDFGEGSALVSSSLVFYIILTGVLPALVVFLLPVRRRSFGKNTLIWVGTLLASLVVFYGARMADHDAKAQITRGQMYSITYALQPGAFLVASTNLLIDQARILGVPFTRIGLDAKPGPLATQSPKPVVVFLVMGEAARAMNHQIDGYDRATNPLLSQTDIVNLGSASSCDTSTIPSLRCMFSRFTQAQISFVRFATYENLLDVVAHAGMGVEWYDNDWTPSGAGVAARIKVTKLFQSIDMPECSQGECTDNIFFKVLDQVIAKADGPKLVVLHLAGSHFPYSRRYPPEFEVFKPFCAGSVVGGCTIEELVNAYDNSLLYTDFVLHHLIDTLSHQDKIAASVIYTSDHGESLGENGIFMHSAPLMVAPKEQTTVPFFLWFSPAYTAAFHVKADCIRAKSAGHISHDNVFSTVLGMLDIQTSETDPALNLMQGCD